MTVAGLILSFFNSIRVCTLYSLCSGSTCSVTIHALAMLSASYAGTLQNACGAVLKDWKYDSEGTRQTMAQKFQDIFDGRKSYDWQLDAAEALVLGLDCVVVAGTGAGKTIPFVLPLFVHDSKDKLVLVISPLNALETDQVSHCPQF